MCHLLWSSSLSVSWHIPEGSQAPNVQVMIAAGLFCPEKRHRNSRESGQMQGGWNPLCDGRNAHTTHWIRASLVAQLVKSEWVAATLSCLTLCDPMDCSLPGSSVHGIFQAGTLEWVAMPFSRGSSQPTDWSQFSHTAGRFFTILSHQGTACQCRRRRRTQARSLDQEDPLQKEMATHSSIFASVHDGGAWWATVHGVTESDTTECGRAYTHTHTHNAYTLKGQLLNTGHALTNAIMEK